MPIENTTTLVPANFVITLGPRQEKVFQQALRECSRAGSMIRELTGVIGVPELDRHYDLIPLLGGPMNPLHPQKINDLQARLGREVTPENYLLFVEELGRISAELRVHPRIDDKRITAEEHAKREAARADRRRQDQERDLRAAKMQLRLRSLTPAWAQAAILAELHQNDSDLQTDYHAHSTQRTVLIGFRSGRREDFRQLRTAAAAFPETKHLGPDCEIFFIAAQAKDGARVRLAADGQVARWNDSSARFTTRAEAEAWLAAHSVDPAEYPAGARVDFETVEHRENYSMGDGNYLKAGHSDASGWAVSSRHLGALGSRLADLEIAPHLLATPALAPAVQASPESSAQAYVKFNEEMNGVELHFPEKPDAPMISALKAAGFRWSWRSVCWYARRTPETIRQAYGILGQTPPASPSTPLDGRLEKVAAAIGTDQDLSPAI